MKTRNLLLLGAAIVLVASAAYAMPSAPKAALAQDNDPNVGVGNPNIEAQSSQSTAALMAYWTPERMAEALPMDITIPGPSNPLLAGPGNRAAGESPVYINGNGPGEAPGGMSAPTLGYGPLPGPNNNNTPPTWYTAPGPSTVSFIAGGWPQLYPMRTNGVLFFSQNGGNWRASATSVTSGTGGNRRMVWTTANNLHDGSGIAGAHWSSNLLFCPAYVAGHNGPWGCWGWQWEQVNTYWYNNANLRLSWGAIVTADNAFGRSGDVLGTQGMTFGWVEPAELWMMGYPATTPYNGNALVWTTAGQATEDNPGDPGASGAWLPVGAGNDQTGGSGGGAWLLNARLGATGFLGSTTAYSYGGELLQKYGPWNSNTYTAPLYNAVRVMFP